MKNNLIAALLCLATAIPAIAQKADKRLAESTAVLKTILAKSDIPKALLNKAECVIVYPSVKKVGLGISGMGYGRGCSSAVLDPTWLANGEHPSCTPWTHMAWVRN